ncbi:anthranilate synthase component II [Cesiribacter andamanensis]|uniref:Para-aminobenzoate synthase glutamine amidotransferase component II n=1 Tax=Cesiribacter andamanensis AMV16 TaxID=1279009 RepID=M7N562_9BACT|nr:aminodeoxychorismate/anthranilate synthase component II [Cesiribacter andamanensis]EMR03753.1 Para-aminobenzoate synthase glutamine amidotransferase component II [Cesiribacter andamanensis AMV16]
MVLLLDNFDSFTWNLADYLHRLGADCRVVQNDQPLSEIKKIPFTGLILSPGPQTPAKAGCLMEVIHQYHDKVPVLGVCLGHQALGEYFGAELHKAARPMHGKISSIVCQPDPIFAGLPRQLQVVRYHSLLLRQLPPSLESIAETASGELMALRHRSLPIRGVQFHPEAILTEGGLALLKNWLSFNHLAGPHREGHSQIQDT